MKKIVLSLLLMKSLTAQAGLLDMFDVAQALKTYIAVTKAVAVQLEKVRLVQNQNLDIRQQWDLTCETTQNLNQGLVALNKMFSKYKVNQETYLPITATLIEIVKNCQNFYSKPVPDNAEILMNKLTASLFQSRMVLVKCYPSLKDIKIPGLP